MRKSFKFRIFPTKVQETKLLLHLEECRWLYNHLLEDRKTAWEVRKESRTLYGQQKTFTALKTARPSLKEPYAQALQNVSVRLDLAFQAFFRRVKLGEEPGYPRFKGKGRYDSLTYPQSGWNIAEKGLKLSKIGLIKTVLHRPVEGIPKTCTVKRTSTGKWFTAISCEIPVPTPLPSSTQEVGIDVGLNVFAARSDGEVIENPRFFRKEEAALAKANRRLQKFEKGTKERAKARRVVARVYERSKWRRDDFTHQHSRCLINQFGVIAVEDIETNRLIQKAPSSGLRKSILDAAWSSFIDLLVCKAEWAGTRKVVKVNPAYTSQICSSCGQRQKFSLSDRMFVCPNTSCGLTIDRDVNAAKNILALGRQCLGPSQEWPQKP